jgi:hypothetical protein
MGVGLNLRFSMGCKWATASLYIEPFLFNVTNFAFIAFASFADQVSAAIGAHSLPFHLFAADPAEELSLDLF